MGRDGRARASRSGRVKGEPRQYQKRLAQFATLVDELAHEILHGGKNRVEISKQQKETEAEAVAFVVSKAVKV
jgi:hypothetical protein